MSEGWSVSFGENSMSHRETDTMGTVAAGSAVLSGWLDGLRRIDPVLAGRVERTPVVLGTVPCVMMGVEGQPSRQGRVAWFVGPYPHLRAFVHEIGRAVLGIAGDLAVEAGDAILDAVLAEDADRYWILRRLVDLAVGGDLAAIEVMLGMELREAYARGDLVPSWECGDPDVRDRLLRESEPQRLVLACVEGMLGGDEWWTHVACLVGGEARPRRLQRVSTSGESRRVRA